MLARIKTMWRLNEAAVVTQNLLEQHRCPFAKDVAYRWIAEINAQKPDLFNGRFGQRPHKISIAAVALTQGLDPSYHYAEDYAVGALGTLIADLRFNGRLYPFNGIDHTLLEAVDAKYSDRLSDFVR